MTTDSPAGRWQGYTAAMQRAAVGRSVLHGCGVAGQRDTRGEGGGWTRDSIYVYGRVQIFQFLRGSYIKARHIAARHPDAGYPATRPHRYTFPVDIGATGTHGAA